MSEPSPADATDPAATRARDSGTRDSGTRDSGTQNSSARDSGTQNAGTQNAGPAQPARPARSRLLAGPVAALENWRVSWRLIALIVVPTAMGLAFAGLQVSMAERNAQTMGRVERLATLGQQITGLAQAMEDERDDTAGFIAHGRPAAGAGPADQAVCGHRPVGRPGPPARPAARQRLPGPDAGRGGRRPQQHRRSA